MGKPLLPAHDQDGVLILESLPTPPKEPTKPITTLNMIAAIQGDYGIGVGNSLLHQIPKDLEIFKAKTLNKTIIMGKNTWDSLPTKPLPNRTHIVLSTKPRPTGLPKEVIWVDGIDKVFAYLAKHDVPEAWVIGGATLYKQFYPYCTELHLTYIHQKSSTPADTFFPRIFNQWPRLAVRHFEAKLASPDFEISVYENPELKPLPV